MDTRVGRSRTEARSGSVERAEQRWVPALAEMALELPVQMARGVVILLHPGTSLSSRDGIHIGPMSYDWLRQCSVDSGKRGDHS